MAVSFPSGNHYHPLLKERRRLFTSQAPAGLERDPHQTASKNAAFPAHRRDRTRLKRFRGNQPPEQTAVSPDARPEVILEGVLRLLALYLVLACGMAVSYLGAATYVRSRPGICQLLRQAADGLLDGPMRILLPFDVRACPWDLAADIDSPSAVQQVAAILIPEDKETKQPFFIRVAVQLFAGVLTVLPKLTTDWEFRDAIFIMESETLLRQVLGRFPETAKLIEEFFDPPETLANVRSEIAIWMRRYWPIAACWHHAAGNGKVSLKNWVSSDEIIVLGQDEANRFQMEAINRAIFLRASQLLLGQDNSEERRAWVVIDEVREMGNLEGLSRLLTNGRSEGACFAEDIRRRRG